MSRIKPVGHKERTSVVCSTQMFKRWSPGCCKNRLVIVKTWSNIYYITLYLDAILAAVQPRRLGGLTRCEMCMVNVLCCSQTGVHHILRQSAKIKWIRVEAYLQVLRTFFKIAFVSGWSKAPAMFKRVTFRSDLFSTVTVNVFFSPFTTSSCKADESGDRYNTKWLTVEGIRFWKFGSGNDFRTILSRLPC